MDKQNSFIDKIKRAPANCWNWIKSVPKRTVNKIRSIKWREINWKNGLKVTGKSVWAVSTKVVTTTVNIALTVALVGAITGMIVGVTFLIYISNMVSDIGDEFDGLFFADQEYATQFFIENPEFPYNSTERYIELEGQQLFARYNRVWASIDLMPQHLIDAFLAIEDRRFMDHNGVDWIRTTRATMGFMTGNIDSGGSTLTQQLIKNITGDMDNTPQRKIQEIFRALHLERTMSKQQILEMYLNTIYLGRGNHGVQTAAWSYFRKCVSELTLIEAAAIAAITQSPARWNPRANGGANNAERRRLVLFEMLNQGRITQAEFDEVIDAELAVFIPGANVGEDGENGEQTATSPTSPVAGGVTSWYIDAVIEDLRHIFMRRYNVTSAVAVQMVYSAGFRVVIAQNPDVQRIMEEFYSCLDRTGAVTGHRSTVNVPQSGMIVLCPQTSNVLGIVGARGEKTGSRAWCFASRERRQPGSSFKPLSSYAPALQRGLINYATAFDDVPVDWLPRAWPRNAGSNNWRGMTTVWNGLARSINTMPVQIVQLLGVEYTFNFLTDRLGFTTLVREGRANDMFLNSMALGGLTRGVSVREMTQAYSIFTSGGVFNPARTVLRLYNQAWEREFENHPEGSNVVLSYENHHIMRQLLWDCVNTSVATGGNARISGVRTYGKTGSTDGFRDQWFIGFTAHFLAGTWFGYQIPRTISRPRGNPSVRLWQYVMAALHDPSNGIISAADRGTSIRMPNTILQRQFCRDGGGLLTDACRNEVRGNRAHTSIGFFTADNMPTACTVHIMRNFCTHGNARAGSRCNPTNFVQRGFIVPRGLPGILTARTDERLARQGITIRDRFYEFDNPANLCTRC